MAFSAQNFQFWQLLLTSLKTALFLPTHTVLSRGESHSPCYRILSRWGDWMWVRSKSYMMYNQRSQLPEGIVIYTWIVRYVSLRY